MWAVDIGVHQCCYRSGNLPYSCSGTPPRSPMPRPTRRRLALLGAAGLAVAIAVAGTTYASAAANDRAESASRLQVAAAPATFAHPGVFVSRAQLDFVRGKVQAGAQPWKAAYDQM